MTVMHEFIYIAKCSETSQLSVNRWINGYIN